MQKLNLINLPKLVSIFTYDLFIMGCKQLHQAVRVMQSNNGGHEVNLIFFFFFNSI